MRNILLVTWLLLPIGAWAYHEGPGQDQQALEATDAVLVAAHEAAREGRWEQAIAKYEAALTELPKNPDAVASSTTQRLQLELNKARMESGGLADAREELEELVETMSGEKGTDAALLAEARQALARAQFYNTWLMRLEGYDRDVWEPEIEASRQTFRLLAEQATDPKVAAKHQGDLEGAIRLARMNMEDLQAMPLPCQCKGCCSGNCNGKKPGKGKKHGNKPNKGAGSGPPLDNGGS